MALGKANTQTHTPTHTQFLSLMYPALSGVNATIRGLVILFLSVLLTRVKCVQHIP